MATSLARPTATRLAAAGGGPVNVPHLGTRWRLILAAGCLAVLVAGNYRLLRPQEYQAQDFGVYFEAALNLRAGVSPYARTLAWMQSWAPGGDLEPFLTQSNNGSDLTGQGASAELAYRTKADYLGNRGRVYLYGPTFALLLVPFTFVPFQVAVLLWGVCNTAFLALMVFALLRLSGVRPSPLAVLMLVTFASVMSAVRAELFLGQADLFTLACICTALWQRHARRIPLAALLLALAFVTKPALLIFAVFLLWKREYRLAIASVGGFVLLVLAPFVWLGGGVLTELLSIWNFSSSHSRLWEHNVALRGLLDRLFTVNPFAPPLVDAPLVATGLWMVIGAAIFLVCLAVIAPRKLRRDSQSLLEVGAMSSGALLISPLSEPQYHVFLIISWVSLLVYLSGVRSFRSPFRWILAALVGLWLMEINPEWFDGISVAGPVTPSLIIAVGAFALQIYTLTLSRAVKGTQP